MLKEFKDFAFKGNMIDMAVGFILGGAFGTVVKSLVDNVVMPPLGALLAGVDFSKMKYVLQEGVVPQDAGVSSEEGSVVAAEAVAEVAEVALYYGQFIQDLIAFLLLAFVVFIIVKKVMASSDKEDEEPVVEAASQEQLLTEIRDLLRQQGSVSE